MKPLVIFSGILLFALACQNNNNTGDDGSKDKRHCKREQEVVNGDTLNILGCDGRQGIWVPRYNNELKDTVFYKNGKQEPLPAGWLKSNNYTSLRASGFKE
jgi:hypothetical protein